MVEVAGRLVDVEASRAPAANSWKLYFTATRPTTFGLDVCNSSTQDAHVSVWILEPELIGWLDGNEPPQYTRVVWKQRVEADSAEGSIWVMPVKHLEDGDRVVVLTDTALVTFYGHGYTN